MNKPIYSDKALFEHIANGSTEAFEIIFNRYYPILVRVLMRYSRDPEQIKDWIQEIYIKLWETRESVRWQEAENMKAYFIVLARNHVIRGLNKKKQIRLTYEEGIHELEIADNNLEEGIGHQELNNAYQSALAKMPHRTREAYALNREQGMTYSRVAQQLGTSVKTVETQISRAIAILRRELITFLN